MSSPPRFPRRLLGCALIVSVITGLAGCATLDTPIPARRVSTPLITAVVPDTTVAGEARPLLLMGSGFDEDLTLFVGGERATSARTLSDQRVQFTPSPRVRPGRQDVVVTNSDTGTTTLAEGLIVLSSPLAPVLRSIEPTSTTTGQSAIVTVVGDRIEERTRVIFGQVPGQVLSSDGAGRILVAVPAGLPVGSLDVTVLNPDNLSDSRPGFFRVTEGAPAVSFRQDVVPLFGQSAGGLACSNISCHGGGTPAGALLLTGTAEELYSRLRSPAGSTRGPVALPGNPGSLLFTQPTGLTRHGGGVNFGTGSPEAQVLLNWLVLGAPLN